MRFRVYPCCVGSSDPGVKGEGERNRTNGRKGVGTLERSQALGRRKNLWSKKDVARSEGFGTVVGEERVSEGLGFRV